MLSIYHIYLPFCRQVKKYKKLEFYLERDEFTTKAEPALSLSNGKNHEEILKNG